MLHIAFVLPKKFLPLKCVVNSFVILQVMYICINFLQATVMSVTKTRPYFSVVFPGY